jgi:hypothetical protein
MLLDSGRARVRGPSAKGGPHGEGNTAVAFRAHVLELARLSGATPAQVKRILRAIAFGEVNVADVDPNPPA